MLHPKFATCHLWHLCGWTLSGQAEGNIWQGHKSTIPVQVTLTLQQGQGLLLTLTFHMVWRAQSWQHQNIGRGWDYDTQHRTEGAAGDKTKRLMPNNAIFRGSMKRTLLSKIKNCSKNLYNFKSKIKIMSNIYKRWLNISITWDKKTIKL